MEIGSPYARARRVLAWIWGAIFIWIFFVLLPQLCMEWSDSQGWPRWQSGVGWAVGGLLVAAGGGVLLYCTGLFAWIGRGTPVPFDPPQHLVVRNLYRYSRNPIYVAYAAILFGLFLHFGHLGLLVYAGVVTLVIEALLLLWEEPGLRRRFGDDYARYTEQVPRWLGLRRPWREGER